MDEGEEHGSQSGVSIKAMVAANQFAAGRGRKFVCVRVCVCDNEMRKIATE